MPIVIPYRYLLFIAATFFLYQATLAQRVSFSMAARLDATATIHSTAVGHYAECNTYLIDGEPFYDTPNVLPFYARSVYRMKLDFVGFHNNTVITPGNFNSKGYQLKTRVRYGMQPPRSLAIDVADDLPVFSLGTTDPTTTDAAILVELYDESSKMVADAAFPFEVIPQPDPSEAVTVRMPFKYHVQQATMQIIDRENTKNRITTDITFGGTVAVQEGKEYIIAIFLEKSFLAGQKELSLSINGKEDYGHRVEFEWQGPALPLKLRTENGLYAYLIVAPPIAPVDVVVLEEKPQVAAPPKPVKETDKVRVSPTQVERAKVAETAKVTAAPKATVKPTEVQRVQPPVLTMKDVAVVRRFDQKRIHPPIKVEEVKQIETAAFQQALRKNPELLKVKAVAPEITLEEAEQAAGAPTNTYTVLIHLINEFGEEDSSPKPVNFVVLKK